MMYIDELIGQTLSEIIEKKDRLVFITTTGKRYIMYHEQDCCESVTIEDIVGDLDDLIGSPILKAREDTNHGQDGDYGDTCTWTFYNIETMKGAVTIRWYGSSNGYYSESVSVESISRMPKWMKMIYKLGAQQEVSNIKAAVFQDIERCFIGITDNLDPKMIQGMISIQELINYLHDNDASLV